MADDLLKELCPALTEIARDGGWKIIKKERDGSFGNVMVELQASDFAIRITRDRGIVSIDLAPMGKHKWTDLETVLAFIGETVTSRSTDDIANLLAKNSAEIEAIMTSNTDRLEAFEKQRSSEYKDRIFPSS